MNVLKPAKNPTNLNAKIFHNIRCRTINRQAKADNNYTKPFSYFITELALNV